MKKLLFAVTGILIPVLLALIIVTIAEAATIWYVAPGGNDDNSCTSAGAPCASLNGALAKAAAGDTVYVAVGEYRDPSKLPVKIDRDITILGGWDDMFTNQTGYSTLNGDGYRGVIIDSGMYAILERVIILKGHTCETYTGGGGILNKGYLTLRHAKVLENGACSGGGGIESTGSLTIEDSEIRQNSGNAQIADSYLSTSMTIRRSVIDGNGVGSAPGIVIGGGTVLIEESSITNNGSTYSGSGGGLAITGSSLVTISNSTVSGNHAAYKGGGIYIGTYSCNSPNCKVELNNVTISHNSALVGGGLSGSDVVKVHNTIIADNSAPTGNDCDNSGWAVSTGFNLIGDATGCQITLQSSDLINVNPHWVD